MAIGTFAGMGESPWSPISRVSTRCWAGELAEWDFPLVVARFPDTALWGWPTDFEASPSKNSSRARFRPMPVPCGPGGRLYVLRPGKPPVLLTGQFHSAADPAVSFDGKRVLFAGRRREVDSWSIFEIKLDGTGLRQITRGAGHCRLPRYQSTLYTIVSTEPWYQITFVGDQAGTLNDEGTGIATHLYACRLDGSQVHRLTYNVSDDSSPFLMGDGRLLYSARQRSSLEHGSLGRAAIMSVGIDGADGALFASTKGRQWKRTPCITDRGLVTFVESDRLNVTGGGEIGRVSFRRPLRTYQALSTDKDGQFAWPSPWPGGGLLVSHRTNGTEPYAVCLYDPVSNRRVRSLASEPGEHVIQAVAVRPIREPDGRSSVVNEADPFGRLYCLNARLSDMSPGQKWSPDQVRRIRVLEGVPGAATGESMGRPHVGTDLKLAPRRVLGEIDVCPDGSFNIQIPANTPIQLQAIDGDGLASRSCGWIWVRNRERRGCIGCHEDGELVPENILVDAVKVPSVPLTPARDQRTAVDFRHDVYPLVADKCFACHGPNGTSPVLAGTKNGSDRNADGASMAYLALLANRDEGGKSVTPAVLPGSARTSPLVWHVLGRNTTRSRGAPYTERKVVLIPPQGEQLTEAEQQLVMKWIDLGALFDKRILNNEPTPTKE